MGAGKEQEGTRKSKEGKPSYRNQIIGDVWRHYGYVEAGERGIRVKVIPLMAKKNHGEPAFEATEDYLKITLYRKA